MTALEEFIKVGRTRGRRKVCKVGWGQWLALKMTWDAELGSSASVAEWGEGVPGSEYIVEYKLFSSLQIQILVFIHWNTKC